MSKKKGRGAKMLAEMGFTLGMVLNNWGGTPAHDITHIRDLADCINYPLYAPALLGTADRYEVKSPETCKPAKPQTMAMINYFDSHDRFIFGITQKKYLSRETYVITEFDVKSGKEIARTAERIVALEPRGERVAVNGTEGRYEAYVGRGASGGILKWVQSGTYMEMQSGSLSRASMIEIAESMNKVT